MKGIMVLKGLRYYALRRMTQGIDDWVLKIAQISPLPFGGKPWNLQLRYNVNLMKALMDHQSSQIH